MLNVKAKSIILKVFGALLAPILSLVVVYYGLAWFKTDLVYYQLDTIEIPKGLSSILPGVDLQIKDSPVVYKNKEYSSLRVERFEMINENWQPIKEGAQFFFVIEASKPIQTEKVVDILFDYSTSSEDIIRYKRNDDASIGPGLTLLSAIPPSTKMQISLILHTSLEESDIYSNREIELRKVSRAGERLRSTNLPDSKMISMPIYGLIITIICSALVYGLIWLGTNIWLHNYSSGARILNWIFVKLFGEGFIKE